MNTTAAPPVLLDIASYEDTAEGDYRVRHPITGAATGMTVRLAGPEHPLRKAILHARQRRMRSAIVKTAGRMPVSDPEADEADEIDRLVQCTLGWSGAQPAYTPEAARAIYSDPKRRWLRDQVAEALEDRELFTRACVPS